MKIDFISDTHIDFWVKETNPQKDKFQKQIEEYAEMIGIKDSKSDVLIIPGDLGHYANQDMTFLLYCKTIYKHVFLVTGNHDLYLISNAIQKKYVRDSWNRKNEMKKFCRDNGIHYLDGNIISVDGVTFAGTGMSWDKSYYNFINETEASDYQIREYFNNTMNDSRLIFKDGKDNYKVPTAYGGSFLSSGFDSFKYFNEEYNKLQRFNDFDYIDVMVSHYGPIIPDTLPEHYQEQSTTFYYFDGKKDVERINPKFWLYGHSHINYDFKHNNTRLICNPLGYPGENTYNKVKTIEI